MKIMMNFQGELFYCIKKAIATDIKDTALLKIKSFIQLVKKSFGWRMFLKKVQYK